MLNITKQINTKAIVEYWPILVLWPTLLGYIGFYTYASQCKIAFAQVDISTIMGLGIFNMIVIFFLVNPRRKKIPSMSMAFLTLGYINFLTLNPIIIIGLISIDLQIWNLGFQTQTLKDLRNKKTKKAKRYAELRKAVRQRDTWNLIFDFLCFLAIVVISIFWVYNILIIFFGIFAFLHIFHRAKKNKKYTIPNILALSLIVPMFTSYYYFSDVDYTIFGLSKESASIELKSDEEVNCNIIFKSTDFIYCEKDTTKFQIPINEVENIVKTKRSYRKQESGIDIMKELFSN